MLKRELSPDVTKFVAIYCVVLAHTITYDVIGDHITWMVHDIIYTFHMPLFAIISGYFLALKILGRCS